MSISIDESKLVPNSGVSKEKKSQEKHVEQVVDPDAVKTKKKSMGKRVIEAFVGEDIGDVRGYLIFDVLIPAIKNTTSDLITTGLNMVLFGEAKRPERISRNGQRSYYKSYDSVYSTGRTSASDRSYASYNRRAAHDFDDLVFRDRSDAEEVLANMADLIEIYGVATVADLYDLIGKTGSYTDRGWGWRKLGNANVRPVRDGYILEMPRAEVI